MRIGRDVRSAQLFAFLAAAAAAVLVCRLAGFGAELLPGAGVLALVLAAVHLASTAARAPRARDWLRIAAAGRFELVLGLAVALALIVRLPGLGADLGHTPLDIDEARLAGSVKHFFDTGQLQHLTVEHYPGAVFWIFAAAAFLNFLRDLTSGADVPHTLLTLDGFVLASRTASVCMAAATVAVTGLLGKRLTTAGAALLAAFVVAIVPLSVETTTVVRNDRGMALAVVAAVYAALVFHASERTPWLVAAGVLAGVATGIKYSSVFAIVPVLIAAAWRGGGRQRLVRCAIAALGFCAAVAVTNHFVWADFPTFVHQLADQVAITARGHWAASDNPAAFYTMVLGRFGSGWLLLVLAGAFAVYGLTTRRAPLWIFLSFPLLYLWFMTKRPSQFPRWVFPLLPFVAVAGTSALGALVAFVRTVTLGHPRRIAAARAAIALLVCAVLAQPVWMGTVSFSRRLTAPTHALAEAWIATNAPHGAVVVSGDHWLDLSRADLVVRRVDLENGLPGVEQLAGADWLVVPEPYFGSPVLRRLGFLQRFHAERSFGGHVGYDFEVYAVPKK